MIEKGQVLNKKEFYRHLWTPVERFYLSERETKDWFHNLPQTLGFKLKSSVGFG
jgi:hypothetical protein